MNRLDSNTRHDIYARMQAYPHLALCTCLTYAHLGPGTCTPYRRRRPFMLTLVLAPAFYIGGGSWCSPWSRHLFPISAAAVYAHLGPGTCPPYRRRTLPEIAAQFVRRPFRGLSATFAVRQASRAVWRHTVHVSLLDAWSTARGTLPEHTTDTSGVSGHRLSRLMRIKRLISLSHNACKRWSIIL